MKGSDIVIQLERKNLKFKMHQLFRGIVRNKSIYLFILPAILYFILFKYMPLYFVQTAFKDFRVTRAISESEWVGFQNFVDLFRSPGFAQSFSNTIIISFYKIVFGFPMPILLALMLNEVRSQTFKKLSQTIVYFPHFISWSIIGGIVYNLLSINGGVVNEIIVHFGMKPVFFMGEKALFRPILIAVNIWKETGWGTILYLAALTRIDPGLYEAAYVDGANRFRRLLHITLPGITSTIVVLLIIKIGHILDIGAEEILVMSNQMVLSVADVIDTFVFRIGLQEGRYSIATAAGLFKAAVAAILVLGSDKLSKSLGERGLF